MQLPFDRERIVGREEVYEETLTYDEKGQLIRKVRSIKRDLTEGDAAELMHQRHISFMSQTIKDVLDPLLAKIPALLGLPGPESDHIGNGNGNGHHKREDEKVVDAEFSVAPPAPKPAPPKAKLLLPPLFPPPINLKLPPMKLPGPK